MKFIFTVVYPIILVSANHFTFNPTSRLSTVDNWLNDDVPCIGDRVRFDNSLPIVAFIDHNVNVESITLPENGIVVFTDNGVDLGGDAHWQCQKSGNDPKDAFFQRDENYGTSFYSPKNWIVDTTDEPFLHINRVPSEFDDVSVSSLSSAQIYLDLPVVVNTFQWYKRHTMTTEDFNVLLRSMEGQFQLVLPKPWARESDQGGVQRMLADDAVMVRNQKLETPRQGRVNPNARNETLSTICAYVKCSTGEASKCAQSFVPFGHCCAVCGAKIEIIAWNLDFDLTKTKIRQHVAEMGVEHKVETSLERKTVDDLSSKYEILLALNPGHEFDEETFEIATRRIIADLAITLKTHTHRSIMDFTIHLSKVDMTILPVSRVVASLIYFSILIVLLAGYVYKNVELRVSRNDIFKPVIRYRRQNDDVAIELDNVPEDPESLQTPEEEKSEEEHSDVANPLDVNPNFEPAGIELTDLVNTENLIEI